MAIHWTPYDWRSNMDMNPYAGYVLEKRSINDYRIMSDVWCPADFALVWDAEKQEPAQVLVNVYDMNGPNWKPDVIEVDATDEVKSLYRQWKINLEATRRIEDAELEAQRIQKGCIAKVVKGKTGKGTIGKVVVAMQARYGMGWRSSVETKLGIATSDVKYKKALSNGKVVDAYQDMIWVWARNAVRVDVGTVDRDAIRREVEAAIAA